MNNSSMIEDSPTHNEYSNDYTVTPKKNPFQEYNTNENAPNLFQKTPKRILYKENNLKDQTIQQIQQRNLLLEKELEDMHDRYEKKKNETEQLKKKNEELEKKIKEMEIQEAKMKENEEKYKTKVEDVTLAVRTLYSENQYHKNLVTNLNDHIQELKGNMRVYCRLKPNKNNDKSYKVLLERGTKGESAIKFEIPQKSNVGKEKVTIKQHEFIFDHVFDSTTTQEELYLEMQPLIQSCMQGANCCVFAYGQTGSGKTFTMQGEGGDARGVIPRSMETIFNIKASNINFDYTFEIEYFEIYNENIRDLQSKKKVEKVQQKDLINTKVESIDEILTCLNECLSRRSVDSTELNDRSSRSHSIFSLKIKGMNKLNQNKFEGSLNLIDLAGSERIKNSKVTGAKMKETQAINTSLSALGKVMTGLRSKQDHVPFRDSTLTKILKPCLEGKKSKVLMVVNIDEDCLTESINSLNFASTVNSCKLK
eukprot:gene8011-12476_t